MNPARMGELEKLARTRVIANEHDEQAMLMQMVSLHEDKYPDLALIYANVNAERRTRWQRSQKLKEGMKAGVPDLFLPVARVNVDGTLSHGLYVEMKRTVGGRVSLEQEKWIARLRRQGFTVEVCRGYEEAWPVLVGYVSLPTIPPGFTMPRKGP